MPKLSINQIARLALDAGWSGEDAAIATAIAMGESGGSTDARGDTTIQTSKWGPSIGLWQIRSLKADKGSGKQRDEIANLSPAINARHAYQISNGGDNWGPWSVYTSGAYRTHLAAARMAVGAPGDVPASDGATVSGSGGLDLLDGGTWARVGLFLMGGILMLLGLYRMTGIGEVLVSAGKSAIKARTGVSV